MAWIISTVLSPLVLVTIAPLLFLLPSSHNLFECLKWVAYTGIFMLVLIFFIYKNVRSGAFSDFDVSQKNQRWKLLLFVLTLLIVYILGLFILHAPQDLFRMFFAITSITSCQLILSHWIKASGHVAVTTAFTVAVFAQYGGWSYAFLLLIPVMMWSRMRLKRHSLSEVLMGFLIGLGAGIVFS